MDRAQNIALYLTQKNWMNTPVVASQVSFLAAGEYNENWLIRCANHSAVFRINHGSQLNQADQIGYEYSVLRHVAASGVTPQPFALDSQAGEHGFGNGVLLMEYLPGTPLQYERDSAAAAALFAKVHSCPVPPQGTLVAQPDPVKDIADECLGLLTRQPDHPRKDVLARLLAYRDEVLQLGADTKPLFADEPQVITNTEVNSGNFILLDAAATRTNGQPASATALYLVDWEKAVVSCCHQDLGHFLIPTTTRWRTDFTYTPEGRMDFLREYLKARTGTVNRTEMDALHERTRVLERTILLRALSWCYMAWYEYERQQRALRNAFTFSRITSYLDNIEWILKYGE
ncbi:aminoglycoside phosphotransferase family protein [Oleidesulfovibrio sp.]|uniref:aminoglycoside phosphotransferase family protein n=1 Tax=Oleidesulfovibrio sp. TaxID=2909707 RepID=UPI003A83B0DB